MSDLAPRPESAPPPPGGSSPDPFLFLKRWPWERIATWTLFVALLWVLRDFFAVIVLTFVLTYVLGNVAGKICRLAGRPAWTGLFWRITVVGLYTVFVLALVLGGRALYPRLHAQAASLLERGTALAAAERLEGEIRAALGDDRFEAVTTRPAWDRWDQEIARRERSLPLLQAALDEALGSEAGAALEAPGVRRALAELAGTPPSLTFESRIDEAVRQVVGDAEFAKLSASPAYRSAMASARRSLLDRVPQMLAKATTLVNGVLLFALHVLLSLIFSFLLLLDLPRLLRRIRVLEKGSLGPAYREIAPSLAAFGSILGRALQAQLFIAVVNTILTGIGLVLLGVESPLFLSIVVFFCSFVPVVGAVMSSVPIGLVALQQDGGGFGMLLEVILLVIVIHAIEAYFLNPRILGSLLHIHPLIVLVVLLVAEHFFGVWGLLLGVPVAYYVFNRFIQGEKDRAVAEPGDPPAEVPTD